MGSAAHTCGSLRTSDCLRGRAASSTRSANPCGAVGPGCAGWYTADMISQTKAFVIVPFAALLTITGCVTTRQPAQTTTTKSTSGTMTAEASSAATPSSTATSTRVAVALPESCTADPAGGFGLTGVEVSPAAGHPDGAKTVRWITNTPIPKIGTVAFTLTSGSILRGLKFNDGEVVGNYVFHTRAAKQDNIAIPPGTDGNTVSVFIPASAAPELGTTWSADLEVDGHSTGKCAP